MNALKAHSTPRKDLNTQSLADTSRGRTQSRDHADRDLAFRDWLLERNIDCQTLTPELEQSLRIRFKHSVLPEPQRMLVIPCDGLWPTRAYWAHRSQ